MRRQEPNHQASSVRIQHIHTYVHTYIERGTKRRGGERARTRRGESRYHAADQDNKKQCQFFLKPPPPQNLRLLPNPKKIFALYMLFYWFIRREYQPKNAQTATVLYAYAHNTHTDTRTHIDTYTNTCVSTYAHIILNDISVVQANKCANRNASLSLCGREGGKTG